MTALHNRTETAELGHKTPMKALIVTVPSNSRLRELGCVAFVHKHKENRRREFKERTEKGMCLGNEQRPRRIYLYESRSESTTKDILFDGLQLLFLRRPIERPIVVERHDEASEIKMDLEKKYN